MPLVVVRSSIHIPAVITRSLLWYIHKGQRSQWYYLSVAGYLMAPEVAQNNGIQSFTFRALKLMQCIDGTDLPEEKPLSVLAQIEGQPDVYMHE